MPHKLFPSWAQALLFWYFLLTAPMLFNTLIHRIKKNPKGEA